MTIDREQYVNRCDHCGKPERFCVLCPDCEALACELCGRVECCCGGDGMRDCTACDGTGMLDHKTECWDCGGAGEVRDE